MTDSTWQNAFGSELNSQSNSTSYGGDTDSYKNGHQNTGYDCGKDGDAHRGFPTGCDHDGGHYGSDPHGCHGGEPSGCGHGPVIHPL